jgi:hypothetical protein
VRRGHGPTCRRQKSQGTRLALRLHHGPRAVNGSDLLFLVVEITQLAHNLFYLLLRCIISFIYVCMRLIFKNMITFIVIIKFT